MRSTRFSYRRANPAVYDAQFRNEEYVRQSNLDGGLVELIKIRASQLNACAFCLDMHSREAIAKGERPERLFVLSAWRESDDFTEKERAALAFTEQVTLIHQHGVTDEVYVCVREHFSEAEIADLIFAINTINAWNRLAIATRTRPTPVRSAEPKT